MNGEDNDAEDIRIKLARNCTFYLFRAQKKLKILRREAENNFMSFENLAPDFRKGYKN